jgi:hypothetical protein
MRLTSIRTSAAVTTAAAAATLALVSGGTANAATVHPMSATGCNNNTCMYIAGNSGGDVLVQAWARNTTFTGHFNLTGPSGFSQVTGLTATWQAGKGT